MSAKKAKAFIFINGRKEMQRLVNIEDWIGKDLKPTKPEFKVKFPTTVTPSGTVVIDLSPAYISLYSARNGHGAYMTISLYNPIFNKISKYPLKTLAQCSNPENVVVPYA